MGGPAHGEWADGWGVAERLPRATFAAAVTYLYPLVRGLPAISGEIQPKKSLAARGRADIEYVTAAPATLALSSRSPRPASVSPLTVSGPAHPGSGGSLLHSFASPKR